MYNWSTLKKLIWLYAAKLKGGASAIIETITGNLPLVLQNAIQHSIKSLTRYGLCTQDGTPTPDAPVDILTNNGALKYGWQDVITTSQLSGYGTYVSPTPTAGNRAYRWFMDLPNGTYTFAVDGDYEIIVQWRDPADPADGLAQGYENLTGWITSGVVTLDKASGGYGIAVKRTNGTSSITPANFDGTLHVQEQGIYPDGTPEVLMVRPGEHLVLSASDFTQEIATRVKTAEFIAVQPGTDYVFAFDLVGTLSVTKYETTVEMYNADGDKLRYVNFTKAEGCRSGYFTAASNEVKVKVDIHGKTSSDTITTADIISFAFDTQSTSYDPAGKNLFNRLNCVYGEYLNRSGNPAYDSKPSCYSCPIPVDSNKKYTFSGISSNVGNNNKRVCFYKADDSFISAQASSVTNADVPYSVTFTPPANTAYCRLSLNTADTEVMLEEGSTQTAYEPYIDASWQTTSVPMLLSVGDVKDEAEIISGIKTGKVGVKVFDGTETVNVSSAGNAYIEIDGVAIGAPNTPINTHFALETSTTSLGTGRSRFGAMGSTIYSGNYYMSHPTNRTAADFKDWLAEQYAAGTPVIVLYPLATATTEHTTAQHLVTHQGTNTVDSVANVSPLEANVKYMAASAQNVLSTLLGIRVTPKDISTQDAEDMIDIITGEDNK